MVKIAHRLYPDWDEQTQLESYLPILHHLGLGLVMHIESSPDSQGVAFVACSRAPVAIGVLWFRHSCCVGCNKLADCQSYAEVDRVIEQMAAAIEWFHPKLLPLWHMQMREQLTDEQERATLADFVKQIQ